VPVAAPVILTYGPHAKGLAFQEGYADQWRHMVAEHPDVARGSSNRYQNWETVDPEKWVPDGYACVRADSRGAGRSPGFLDPFSPREARDLYECAEWAAAQPWRTGKVGINGISYYAMNAWHVAGLPPGGGDRAGPGRRRIVRHDQRRNRRGDTDPRAACLAASHLLTPPAR
jgi:putative CocE/NonD family hydrolase